MKSSRSAQIRPTCYVGALVLASSLGGACGKSDGDAPDGSGGAVASGAAGRAGSSGSGGARAGGPTGGNSGRAGSAVAAGQGGKGGSSGASNPNQGGTAQGGGSAGAAGSAGRATTGGTAAGGAGASGLGGNGAGGATEGGAAGDGSGGEGNVCTAPATPPAAGCGIYGTVGLEYQAGEATGSVLSFSVRLTAAGFLQEAVPLNQIEVQYYLSLEEDSGFQATVESFVQHAPDADYTSTSEISIVKLEPAQKSTSVPGSVCQTHFIRIRNTSAAELAPSENDGPYVELHVTLTPNDATAPNQTHDDDQGYEPDPPTFHSNLGMGVFVCGMLVGGCTPGDAGPCS